MHWEIIINYSLLVGIMVFFVTVVSPSALATLQGEVLASFLRTIFPRMFFLGLVLGIIGNIFCYFSEVYWFFFLSTIITISFLINLFFLTPAINSIRDDQLLSETARNKKFRIYHGISVLLFVGNFVLSGYLVFEQIL
mgnify:FL=1